MVKPSLNKVAALEIKLIQSSDKTVLRDKLNEKSDLQLAFPAHKEVIKSSLEQEILWFLEFDGSVNKLGGGARVWINNKQNSHAQGRAYRLNFRCTNIWQNMKLSY